jgi:acyl-CoA thioester hydrolase
VTGAEPLGAHCRRLDLRRYCSCRRGNRTTRIVATSCRAAGSDVTRRSLEPSPRASEYPFVHQVRARFAETDAMGIIHHAAYLPYLEEARVAYLRHLGHPYDQVRGQGVNFAVLEVAVRYRRPLLFDDLIDVHVAAGAVTGVTFQVAYLLTVGDEARATAVTVHGCVDGEGRPARLPVWVGAALQDLPS